MAKICPNCETENPTAFSFCGKCGFQLVEDEQLSEEDKLRKQLAEQKEQLELLKRNKELEEERLKKKLQEKEKKLKETPNPPVAPSVIEPTPAPKQNNSSKKALIAALSVIAVLVFGSFLFFAVIQPALIDKNAERYYTFVKSTNFRSSKDAGGDYNKIGSVPYGGELITYEHDFDWTYAKYDGKKGYISSDFVLNKEDFVRLNSIWGDAESKDCVSTSKCRRALLSYFQKNNLIGQISSDVLSETMPYFSPSNSNQWQIFCRDVKVKPNNVFFQKLYNKNSKFTDFAVIIKNINTEERRLLIFYFDDDETPHLFYDEPVYNSGYIVNITEKYDYYTEKYYIVTKFSE